MRGTTSRVFPVTNISNDETEPVSENLATRALGTSPPIDCLAKRPANGP